MGFELQRGVPHWQQEMTRPWQNLSPSHQGEGESLFSSPTVILTPMGACSPSASAVDDQCGAPTSSYRQR